MAIASDTKMARARAVNTTLDLTECALCMEPFKMPKCLPCIHTFCLECLKKCMSENDEGPGDEMTCPTCQQTFKLPLGGFEKLPSNIFIEQISISLKTLQIHGSLSSGFKCEVCQASYETKCCVECAQFMCDACLLTHGKLGTTHSHKVVSLADKEGYTVYLRARPEYCDVHKDEQLKLYCYDCSLTTCPVCLVMDHDHHHCEDVQTSSKKLSDELEDCCNQLKQSTESIASEQKSLDAIEGNLLEQLSACGRAVHERGAQLKRNVDQQCSALLSQLEAFRNERIKKIDARRDDAERQLLTLSSLRTYIEEVMKKGSACAISQSAKDLLARAKQLHADQVEFSKGSLSPDCVTFESANIEDFTRGRIKLIGWISINGYDIYLESFLVVAGLSNGGKKSQSVFHISLERQDSVSTIDSTPAWVDSETAACVLGNTLYIIGIGHACNELWKWHAASDWTRCADMSSERHAYCVAVVDSTLYILGGWLGPYGTTQSGVEAYNTQTNEWSAAGQLTHAVQWPACMSYNNSIYVFGGGDPCADAVAHVQLFDAAQHKCTLLHNAMPRGYYLIKAVVWETYAILLGRETCLIYNFESETWQERESFKTGASGFGFVVDNETLYVAGGGYNPYTAEVRSVSVRDVIEDKQEACWTHHATLPQPAFVLAFSPVPLYRASTPTALGSSCS